MKSKYIKDYKKLAKEIKMFYEGYNGADRKIKLEDVKEYIEDEVCVNELRLDKEFTKEYFKNETLKTTTLNEVYKLIKKLRKR